MARLRASARRAARTARSGGTTTPSAAIFRRARLRDPEVRAAEGTWTYTEGCLSLEVDGTHAPLDRPKFVQIRGRTVHGDAIEVTADEVVARICQHEIDHLDGIEYVQRLVGDHHDRVYEVMAADGIDVSVLPDAPY